ncbi:hypothetical protein B0H16DRAFT_1728835 [Mycena metata]|uniref:Uncharacterized protein n=1 Tax=Mycena metata TaxID=1033252 RepID=A0AAD7IEC5_9AGAR|nr:hypothetical protein B0H16DRAFT_1728835 [Mycena metata]
MVQRHIQCATALKIHFRASSSEACRKYQMELFELLLEHSSRWTQLYLIAHPDFLPLVRGVDHGFPHLQRMFVDADVTTFIGNISAFTSTAASVQEISLSVDSTVVIQVPLSAHLLTHYDIDASWLIHTRILRVATQLISARIKLNLPKNRVPKDAANVPPQVPYIVLPRLNRLSLHTTETHALRFLKTPALTRLGLCPSSKWADGIADLVARSGCTILSLSLFRHCSSIDEVAKVLNAHVSIVELNMFNSNLVKDIQLWSMVSHTVQRIAIVPSEDNPVFDYEAFLNIAEARGQMQNTVETCLILRQAVRRPMGVDLERFQSLARSGSEVVVLEGDDALDAVQDLTGVPRWPTHSY